MIISLFLGCTSVKPLVLTDIMIHIQNQSQFEISSVQLKYKQGDIVINDLAALGSAQRRLQTPHDTDLLLDIQYVQGQHYREHLTFVMQAGTVGQLDLSITPQQDVIVSGDFGSE